VIPVIFVLIFREHPSVTRTLGTRCPALSLLINASAFFYLTLAQLFAEHLAIFCQCFHIVTAFWLYHKPPLTYQNLLSFQVKYRRNSEFDR